MSGNTQNKDRSLYSVLPPNRFVLIGYFWSFGRLFLKLINVFGIWQSQKIVFRHTVGSGTSVLILNFSPQLPDTFAWWSIYFFVVRQRNFFRLAHRYNIFNFQTSVFYFQTNRFSNLIWKKWILLLLEVRKFCFTLWLSSFWIENDDVTNCLVYFAFYMLLE